MSRRGTSNSWTRGSAEDRRRRKAWLVAEFGDPETGTVKCSTCPTVLTTETVVADRWPIPGIEGGTYRKGNIRPQCSPCSCSQGGRMAAERNKERKSSA